MPGDHGSGTFCGGGLLEWRGGLEWQGGVLVRSEVMREALLSSMASSEVFLSLKFSEHTDLLAI